MNKTRLKKLILTLSFRRRLIVAGTILLIVAFLLYKLMLVPYVAHFNSLRGQLKAQEKLLDLKVGRAGNLAELNKEYLENKKKLQEVNKYFFTEGESEAFMKQLPKIVANFGNRVILLQPKSKGRVLSRSEKLKKYVLGENLPAEKDIIGFIDKNQKSIDSGEMTREQLIQALRLLPENKKKQFKTIWKQVSDIDSYADLKLRQVDLDATIQGQFKGILSLFEWFDKYAKIINLNRIRINTAQKTSGIKARFSLRLYIIE